MFQCNILLNIPNLRWMFWSNSMSESGWKIVVDAFFNMLHFVAPPSLSLSLSHKAFLRETISGQKLSNNLSFQGHTLAAGRSIQNVSTKNFKDWAHGRLLKYLKMVQEKSSASLWLRVPLPPILWGENWKLVVTFIQVSHQMTSKQKNSSQYNQCWQQSVSWFVMLL